MRVTIYVREDEKKLYERAVKKSGLRGLSTFVRHQVFSYLSRSRKKRRSTKGR